MEHVRDLYPRRNQANGRAKVIGRTHDSVCIGRDAYSKEAVSPVPITAANVLSCHLTFLSYCEGMWGNFLQDTSGVCLSQLVVVHGIVRRPAGFRCCSSPWPHCRALCLACCSCCGSQWPYILTLDLSPETKKRQSPRSPQEAEGRLPLNLRTYLGLICILTISAMDARVFPEVGFLVVVFWYGITCY